MEARLIDCEYHRLQRPAEHRDPAASRAGPVLHYLEAAGIATEDRRRRLAAVILAELPPPESSAVDWPAIVSAADRQLIELLPCPAPAVCRRPMPAQDLERSNPLVEGLRQAVPLLQLRIPRRAQGMAACILWLAALVIP